MHLKVMTDAAQSCSVVDLIRFSTAFFRFLEVLLPNSLCRQSCVIQRYDASEYGDLRVFAQTEPAQGLARGTHCNEWRPFQRAWCGNVVTRNSLSPYPHS